MTVLMKMQRCSKFQSQSKILEKKVLFIIFSIVLISLSPQVFAEDNLDTLLVEKNALLIEQQQIKKIVIFDPRVLRALNTCVLSELMCLRFSRSRQTDVQTIFWSSDLDYSHGGSTVYSFLSNHSAIRLSISWPLVFQSTFFDPNLGCTTFSFVESKSRLFVGIRKS